MSRATEGDKLRITITDAGTSSAGRGAKFLLGSVVLHVALGLVLAWVTGLLSPVVGPPISVHIIPEAREEAVPTPKQVEAAEAPADPFEMPRPLPLEDSEVEPLERPEVPPPPTDPSSIAESPRRPRHISLDLHARSHAPSAAFTVLPPVDGGDDDVAVWGEEVIREIGQAGDGLSREGPERYAALPPATSKHTDAKYRRNPKPQYPRVAREKGYEGDVYLKVLVLHDGTVGEISVHRSSGYEVLDVAALRAVQDWLFVPATRDGVPVARWAIVPVKFRLP